MKRRAVGLVVALVLVLTACGAPGVGDKYFPNYGNGGYYVSHYDLSIQYNPVSNWLTGKAVITARTNQDLAAFNLDLVGLTVKGITVDDSRAGGPAAATWVRDPHELTVVPSRQLNAGESFVVVVRYGGVPAPINTAIGPGGVFHTDDGLLIQGQPESAASWFPVNDHPVDKASYTFRVRVPSTYKVVANGLPAGSTTSAGWTTSIWNAPPMASYLATVDVGQWTMSDRTTASGIRIIDAVDPDVASLATPSLVRQEEMLDFLETQFGDYPFTTAGGIVDDHPGIFFVLETQTRPVYSSIFFAPVPGLNDQGDAVVVHELAHQWYGDSVALSRWKDIWLNEGFATYAEWLWAEHEGTPNAPALITSAYYNLFSDINPSFWNLRIGDPGPRRLFDEAVYIRGAMTLQALRMRVGDVKFFNILRTWAATNEGGHGSTAKFIALSEQITGRDLSALFKNWLYTGKRPAAPPLPQSATARAAPPDGAFATQWREGFLFRLANGQR